MIPYIKQPNIICVCHQVNEHRFFLDTLYSLFVQLGVTVVSLRKHVISNYTILIFAHQNVKTKTMSDNHHLFPHLLHDNAYCYAHRTILNSQLCIFKHNALQNLNSSFCQFCFYCRFICIFDNCQHFHSNILNVGTCVSFRKSKTLQQNPLVIP